MTRPKSFIGAALVAGIMTVACVVLVAVMLATKTRHDANEVKAAKFDSFCRSVKDAVRDDVLDLRDPRFRERAADRFAEARRHSYDEIEMCATPPVDLSGYRTCQLAKNYDCMAALAKTAYQAIPCEDCGMEDDPKRYE